MSSDISSSTSAAPAGFTPFRFHPSWFYFIFAASGFAGLIYESVWTRYLKLFLGHAALAQALVLIIFLFGLAAGISGNRSFFQPYPTTSAGLCADRSGSGPGCLGISRHIHPGHKLDAGLSHPPSGRQFLHFTIQMVRRRGVDFAAVVAAGRHLSTG